MAIRHGDREQLQMFPASIDEYVLDGDPVRVYDVFVEALDIKALGIVVEENKVGNPAYDPKSMLKLLVYGYSYGWRSSRKLERALYHNLSFIWLMGGLKPDHKTIANFRRNNKEALKKTLSQCVRLCMKLNLIAGNTLFVDGSRMRANASINKTCSKKKWEKTLACIDKRITELLNECERLDVQESDSYVKITEELKDKRVLREKVQAALATINADDKVELNSTDADSVVVKSRQGTHAGYNAQITVDEQHGLIVNSDVINKSNDSDQFSRQVEQANKILGGKCKTVCADAGYANTDNLKETVDRGIRVVVPSQHQALHKPPLESPFSKDKFTYDEKRNYYICPEGKELSYSYYNRVKGHYVYRARGSSQCIQCKHFGNCTSNRRGRSIIRLKHEELKASLEAHYDSPEGQAVYKKRKCKVELPFGHIKSNLKAGSFLLRGLPGVNAEMSLLSTCFNIARIITILGIKKLTSMLNKYSVMISKSINRKVYQS